MGPYWKKRECLRTFLRGVLPAALFGLTGPAVVWAGDAGQACQAAAVQASAETGVPVDVLVAISMIETAEEPAQPDAWPWTVATDEVRLRFPTRDDAVAYLGGIDSDATSTLEVGCFQLDLIRHARGFESAERALDPHANALYAARLLVELHREKGSWPLAAGTFHSRSIAQARSYAAAVQQLRRSTEGAAGRLAGLSTGTGTQVVSGLGFLPVQRVSDPGTGAPSAPPLLGSLFPLRDITDLSARDPEAITR